MCALGDAAALMHARSGTLGVYRCGIPFWRVCAQMLVMGRLLTGEWGRPARLQAMCAYTHGTHIWDPAVFVRAYVYAVL